MLEKPRILVVGPKGTIVEWLLGALDGHFECRWEPYTGFNQALDMFQEQDARWVLVFIDASLIGESLIRSFKLVAPRVEVVMYGSLPFNDVVEGLKEGAFDYWDSIDKATLLRRVRSTLDQIEIQRRFTTVSRKMMALDSVGEELVQAAFPSSSEDRDDKTSSGSDEAHRQLHEEIKAYIQPSLAQFRSIPTVMLVEDEGMYRDLLLRFLRTIYDVVGAGTGEAAAELLAENPHVDVVILDVFLPDCNGVTLLERLLKIKPTVEAVLLSAYELTDVAVQSMRLGAYDYLTKPVRRPDLVKSVDAAIKRSRTAVVMNQLGDQFWSEGLSDGSKRLLLDTLYQNRQADSLPMRMSDLYIFYPNLMQKAGIPDEFIIPKTALDDGILAFLDKFDIEI